MKQTGQQKAGFFATIVIASLFVWSIVPSFGHVPRVLETLNEHIEMVAEHGHSHGFVEDMLWAMHGHDHDEVDHDHSPIVLSSNPNSFDLSFENQWQQPPLINVGSPSFLIERPPRV